ncbi:hypothetical protein BC938DRAFT_480631 [Jimgerdemannia flammicorona]|uniref:CAP-Gly domain-containing protein n=1 Tax=Jimgerdemannia flammicorona TaxID=994334 RepID=A0A433QI94_9FUNG|nr:hypothetical protein BC938DRAFT_480631 [Jimgerdemannia flammicorona]
MSNQRQHHSVPNSPTGDEFRPGDRVVVESMNITGTLRYIGETYFKPGVVWAGIELNTPGGGKNDGSVGGMGTWIFYRSREGLDQVCWGEPKQQVVSTRRVRGSRRRYTYFRCPPNAGLFVVANKLSKSPTRSAPNSPPSRTSPRASQHFGVTSPQLTQKNLVRAATIGPGSVSDGARISSPTPRFNDLPHLNQRRFSNSPASRPHTPSAPTFSPDEESFQHKLNPGTDDATLKMQQMQLRIEVLEAENRFLKLENAQNKNAEKLFERGVLGVEDTATVEATAELDVLKRKLDEERERWRVEKDAFGLKVNAIVREKEDAEHDVRSLRERAAVAEKRVVVLEARLTEAEERVAEAEERVAVAEAQSAAAAAAAAIDRMGPDRRQSMLEEEMESVHEKVLNLTGVIRAKDRFLTDLTSQVEELRNGMEEKEREIRRLKAEFDKERQEMTKEGKNAGDAVPERVEELNKVKAELVEVKAAAEKDKAKSTELQVTVEDLKKACMESLELYETTVEVNKTDIEALRASLEGERRKVKALESESKS